MDLELVAAVVTDHDLAIDFFVNSLGVELVEDSPSATNDGRPKRWGVVRPPRAAIALLLARAAGPTQTPVVGNQVAGRAGFFLRVGESDASDARMTSAGVEFVSEPRVEPYGKVAVSRDIGGNRWDLLGPASRGHHLIP